MEANIKEKVLWCLKKKRGISLIKPNENLGDAYLKKASNSLKAMQLNNQEGLNDWAIEAAYYSRYQAIYALLQKCGIKSEIHGCSITLMKYLFWNKFSDELIDELETAKEQRINLVYYTDKIISEEEIQKKLLQNLQMNK